MSLKVHGDSLIPVYEPIVPLPTECFVWRQDDYPLAWSVWNAHPECEIHLIRNAWGTCHVGDHIGSFAAGDLYIVGRGLPHNWVTPLEPGESIKERDVIVQFDEDRVLGAATFMPELHDLRPFFASARRGIVFEGATRKQAAEMVEALGRAEGVERLALFLRLLHLLASSQERKLLSSENFIPNADTSSHNALRDVLTWMSQHYSSNVRLAQMADMVGMTESSFSRFFKKNTGTTFSRYLSELRVAKTCELLIRSELPITRISQDVGYDNLSNFNKTFRHLRGMPPSRYRHTKRQK